MQDRFKFRAWDNQERYYIPDEETNFCHGMMEYWLDKENCPLTFEQCTGLKDKKSKLIYEGDILASDNECFREKYKVEFCQHYSQFLLIGINTTGGAFDVIEHNSLEIIGNIHENSELLEEAND